MKITLTKMDDRGFTFCCRGYGLEVVLHCRGWRKDEIEILSFKNGTSCWDADNANPRRRSLNTTTLGAVRKVSSVSEAIEAAKERVEDLRKAYQADHSLFDARREIYEFNRDVLLSALLLEVKRDPNDSSGGISVAAARYAELESPLRIDNAFAYLDACFPGCGRCAGV
jgi:hypothetical protein